MATTEDRIIGLLRVCAPLDRAGIAHELGLPAPTVASAVRRLLEKGAIEPVKWSRPALPGRPSSGLRMTGPASVIAVVTWDGAGVRLRLLDAAGSPLRDDRLSGIPDGDFDEIIRTVLAHAGTVPATALRAVVLSVPAPFLRERGGLTPRQDGPASAYPDVGDGDLEERLSNRFGARVLMENDTNLAALGERAGAAKGPDHVLHLKLTTRGFGSALIVNGALVRGAHGYAGELAHLQVDRNGPVCRCGGRGCLWMSIRGEQRTLGQYEQDRVPFDALPHRAAAGDPGAIRLLQDTGRTLGRPLALLCTLLDPEQIIVGADLGPAVPHVLRGIRESLALDAPPAVGDGIRLTVGGRSEDAELRGAIELLKEPLRKG